jgi:hypothetical protein
MFWVGLGEALAFPDAELLLELKIKSPQSQLDPLAEREVFS